LKVKKSQEMSKGKASAIPFSFFLNPQKKPFISGSHSTNILAVKTLVSYKRQTNPQKRRCGNRSSQDQDFVFLAEPAFVFYHCTAMG
jgi:hypothetical protein